MLKLVTLDFSISILDRQNNLEFCTLIYPITMNKCINLREDAFSYELP